MNVFDKNATYLEKRERINLHINWTKPSFTDEADEYDQEVDNYLASKGISIYGYDQLKKFLSHGSAEQLSIKELKKKNLKRFTLKPSQFRKIMKEPGYADNYDRIENELLKNSVISMTMPIILDFGDEYYGFAGNRRMNLAFSHNIPVTFWVVDARK